MRFNESFRGPVIRFGCEVHYFPLSQKDKARVHGMADPWLPGFFAGYKQQAGGGWSGNLKIIDWDEMNEAHHISQIYLRDLPADQCWPQMKNGNFVFPFVDNDLKQPDLKQ